MVVPFPEITPYADIHRGEEEIERSIMHYSSSQSILIVGDGDFSFSLCLAKAFGSASNIVATSLDSIDTLMKKYKQALSNVVKLNLLRAYVLHEVDATKMRLHTDLCVRKFDRIIFNFPHAGFFGKEDNKKLIKKHRNVVWGFFRNASGMLRPDGEIHVNHKTKAPFCHWKLEELAKKSSLLLKETVDFKIEDYPGYNNKRGDGSRSDEPFPLNVCSTYKFILSPSAKIFPHITKSNVATQRRPTHALDIPVTFLPIEFQMPCAGYVQNKPGHAGPVETFHIDELSRIFPEYLNHVIAPFGRPNSDVPYSTREYLRIGFERYTREEPERGIDGYIRLLRELQLFHTLRMAKLTEMLNFDCQVGVKNDLEFFLKTMSI